MQSPPVQEVGVMFPVAGVDRSTEFGRQPVDTAAEGQNVRAFETIDERARGGSRPGLSKFINELVSGANVIQHLNVVVDPQAPVLGVSGDGMDDPSDGGRNLLTDGSIRQVRVGGSGYRHQTAPVFRQFKGLGFGAVAAGAHTLSLTSQPLTNSLLVVLVGTDSPTSDVTVAVESDATTLRDYTGVNASLANQYMRHSSGANQASMSMWYRRIGLSSALEQLVRVTTPATAQLKIIILEYIDFQSAPFDQEETVEVPGATTARSVGPVNVAGSKEIVIGAFMANSSNLVTPDAGYAGRVQTVVGNAVTGSPIINVIDTTVEGPTTKTPSGVSNANVKYVGIGASFKRT